MNLQRAREILSGKLEFGNELQIEALRYLGCEEALPELIREHSETCRKSGDQAGCSLRSGGCDHYYTITETTTTQILLDKESMIDNDEEFTHYCCAECPINKECPNPSSCANRIRARYAKDERAVPNEFYLPAGRDR